MMLTLGQAAKETGLAKSAISRAIKSGRLSAVRQENGNFSIDPAELFRVYPSNSNGQLQKERLATHDGTVGQHREVEVLRELIEQIKSERDSLRMERDKLITVIQEQAGTVKNLTHQPETAANQNRPPEKQTTVRLWLLVALVVVVAVAVIWFISQTKG